MHVFYVPHVHFEEYRMHSFATEHTSRTQNTFFSNSHEEHSRIHSAFFIFGNTEFVLQMSVDEEHGKYIYINIRQIV